MSKMHWFMLVVLLAAILLVHESAADICPDYYYWDGFNLCVSCPSNCLKCPDYRTCYSGFCDSSSYYVLGSCLSIFGRNAANRTDVYAAAAALFATFMALLY
ncbi:hypothetical protein STCU_11057 [Strigomonas culicis]|uniref:Surface antigen-like protein n=1 Tax=Strigomonas culicis TaxID=28005 RepID=S9TJZ9_9TRYP|nr:hypothetical protein STCU_11057 [Strigomonas culicis]|eukprot:EPY16673.1 hypothetical protein STCU_11057 [Strigomonas culicis]